MKVAREGVARPLADERDRLQWASRHLPVPAVLGHGLDPSPEAGAKLEWLVTQGLPGTDATRVHLPPDELVPALARGLRRFHEAPADDCPFIFDLDTALDLARRRLSESRIDPGRDFHPEHAHHTAASAVAALERLCPDSEDLVVCHGDYCLPNALLVDEEVTGYVDLGELGVADRWWDVSVGAWSVTWNLGPGLEDRFFESYGIAADPERIRYYRLLYDVVS